MINLKQNTTFYGHATAGYSVELTKTYNIKEFVNEVLSSSKKWGYIELSSVSLEYVNGELIDEIPNEELSNEVISVKAHGGCNRMDFFVKTN